MATRAKSENIGEDTPRGRAGMASKAPITTELNMGALVKGLMQDIQELREGKLSVQKARAIAELAKVTLRGAHMFIQARRYLEQHLPQIAPPSETDSKPAATTSAEIIPPRRGRPRGRNQS